MTVTMFKAHLHKEWRELRWMVWACVGLLLIAPVGLAWAVPKTMAARLPWFGIALFVAAVTLGSEVVVGDARRRQHDWLARLPGGLRSAFLVKLGACLLGMVAVGAAGWGGETLAEWIQTERVWNGWRHETRLVAWAVLLALWLMASSCWRPHGVSALTVTVAVPAFLLAPLVWLAVGKPGIEPVALHPNTTAVYGIGAGLVLAWFGFRRFLAFPRERRRLRASLCAVALVFAPLWIHGGWNVWRWHHVDPTERAVTMMYGFVGSDGRHAFATLQKSEPHNRGLYYAIRVDLTDGSWQQVGEAQSAWCDLQALDRGFPYSLIHHPTPLVVHSQCSDNGQGLERQVLLDAVTGEELGRSDQYRFARVPQDLLIDTARRVTPYRLADGSRAYVLQDRLWLEEPDGTRRELPWQSGDLPTGPAGRGFLVFRPTRNKKPYYYDLTRQALFERPAKGAPFTIRRGAWLTNHAVARHRREWGLYWPETGKYGPIQGLRAEEKLGPLADDRRVFVHEPAGGELWLLDPEAGDRTPVRVEAEHPYPIRGLARSPAYTPDGAPVVTLGTAAGYRLGRLDGDTLSCTALTGQRPQILALLDEDTVLVFFDRSIERLRFGEDTRERLFPR